MKFTDIGLSIFDKERGYEVFVKLEDGTTHRLVDIIEQIVADALKEQKTAE